jgi:DHA2 family multidrug resistance protein
MLLMACCCWYDSDLTVQSGGSAFVLSQLMRGLGQVFAMLFLNQAAIASVKPNEAGDASGLFNAARNLGGSIALALLATLQERREDFHHWTLFSAIPANSTAVQSWVAGQTQGVGNDATLGALQSINTQVVQQAVVMSYNDEFVALAFAIVMVIPLVLLLRPLPKGHHKMAMH